MNIFYDLIFLLFAVFYLPAFLFRRKSRAGFFMRLGFLPKFPELNRPIWIHAVSVGEAMAVKHLREELKERFPQKKFVISTVTATGNKIARNIAGEKDLVLYLPLDFSWIVRGVISKVNPSLFVIAETEIWPNLISCLYEKKIPIVLVNARISDRSFGKYLLAKSLLKPLLNKVSVFCAQTQVDVERLLKLGVLPDKVVRTGNMKFDIRVQDYAALKKDYADYRIKFGLGIKEKLFTAASTHPGEEEEILKAYLKVSGLFSDVRLLIAPRHPERSETVEKLINKYGELKAYRISRLSRMDTVSNDARKKPVFILDTVGQLMYFYAISDIVFVGGSLVKKGGHNILEPASLGKPVIFGRYMFNFRDISELFLKNNAGIMVKDGVELEEKLRMLLGDKEKAFQLGRAGRELILENQGAAVRNAETIRMLLEKGKCGKI